MLVQLSSTIESVLGSLLPFIQKEFGKCEIIISLWPGLCEKEALFRRENVKIDNI